MTNGKRMCVCAHSAFICCHSYCVYSGCAEVSDDDSSLHVDFFSKCYGC